MVYRETLGPMCIDRVGPMYAQSVVGPYIIFSRRLSFTLCNAFSPTVMIVSSEMRMSRSDYRCQYQKSDYD